MKFTKIIIMGITLILNIPPSYSKELKVIDADTLRIEGVSYRIFGVDAPEGSQKCDNGFSGATATQWLKTYLKNKGFQCKGLSKDRYERIVAICYADGQDIGKTLVSNGYAFAYFKYSSQYALQHFKAKLLNKPVWKNNCGKPWNYRRK